MGMFDSVAREMIKKRGDEFIEAAQNWKNSADQLSSAIQRLCSLIESGQADPNSLKSIGFDPSGFTTLTTKTQKLSTKFEEFTNKLIEFTKED